MVTVHTEREPILALENVTKSYRNFTLDNITFQIPKGYIFGLIGENGAGKSTTISAILDMFELDCGKVQLFGEDYRSNQREWKQRVGVVIDGLTPFGNYYIKDIQTIMKDVYSRWDTDYFEQLLERFRLPKKKRIKELSKGMTVKLNFAVALAHHPELLILDEATSGLDPVMRDEILELLQEFILEEGRSVLLSTHITSDLDKIADYIIFLHEGKLIFVESKEALELGYGIVNCKKERFLDLLEEDIVAYIREECGYRVLIRNKREVSSAIPDLPVDKASIEDIMLFYIKGEKR